MAQDGQEAWSGLKHDLDDERNDLQSRKAGRGRGALTGVFSVLTQCESYMSQSYFCIEKLSTPTSFAPQICSPTHWIIL